MNGPEIIARTISRATIADRYGNEWQYHPRSDRHSKVACWAILYDLLQASSLLRKHVADGKVTIGINRQLNDWDTGKKKNLDLVVARTPGSGSSVRGKAFNLQKLANQYDLILSETERLTLEQLPTAQPGHAGATVLVAVEAKACMTAHIRALPRLYDELTSSHATVHGDNPHALAVGFVMVNCSESFVSPDLNRNPRNQAPQVWSVHNQPHDTERAIAKIREIKRRPGPAAQSNGFDALGVTVVSMKNDGTPTTIPTGSPALPSSNEYHYEQMIGRAAHLYDSTFGHV